MSPEERAALTVRVERDDVAGHCVIFAGITLAGGAWRSIAEDAATKLRATLAALFRDERAAEREAIAAALLATAVATENDARACEREDAARVLAARATGLRCAVWIAKGGGR